MFLAMHAWEYDYVLQFPFIDYPAVSSFDDINYL